VFDGGEVSSAATGAVENTISTTLPAGWYWLGVNANAAGITVGGANGDKGSEFVPSANAAIVSYLGLAVTYGAFPSTFSAVGSTITTIGLYLRKA
jgi:hypothetical protein